MGIRNLHWTPSPTKTSIIIYLFLSLIPFIISPPDAFVSIRKGFFQICIYQLKSLSLRHLYAQPDRRCFIWVKQISNLINDNLASYFLLIEDIFYQWTTGHYNYFITNINGRFSSSGRPAAAGGSGELIADNFINVNSSQSPFRLHCQPHLQYINWKDQISLSFPHRNQISLFKTVGKDGPWRTGCQVHLSIKYPYCKVELHQHMNLKNRFKNYFWEPGAWEMDSDIDRTGMNRPF